MYGVCFRYVCNREVAQDLLHDGFITVFLKIGSFRHEGSFEGCMRRIFVNTVLAYLRKNDVLQDSGPVDGVLQIGNDEASAIDKMAEAELLRCIGELPDGYRTVLNLFAIEGYSHKEIADMLHISEGTSRSQYLRAKQYLKNMLHKQK